MAPSPSSLFRSLQASAFSSSIRLRALLPGLSPMAYALLALGISSYPFAASFVANHLRARAKAKKTRVKASIQIVHTLANAGVSRKVVAYAVAVTDYPLSVRHVESLRRIGEKNKALRKFIAARKQKDRQKLAEKRRREAEDAEDRRMDEERQKLEEEKRRLERIVKHERAVKLFGDVVNELRQLQRPQSCPPRTRN
ncbi:hypothetical protein L227DRAFT_611689 [Lentinus tigrinus ALCF2SS1-6]|uniref:Uncharacterized protein n=1 Tax=Lentinus tigrinus ALCF2SS1-6 TaxID=1328759 RepID=A0A5C2S7P2_9APHY|nr:hypothetical protein L227DRAFT_611689 [Lentinus tigrinus ALCF2SS1-6]